MPITTEKLAQIADRIATQVRRLIPRSANRYLDPSGEEAGTTWLKDASRIGYTEFIHTVVRAGTKGPGQTVIKQKETVPAYCVFRKTVYRDASVKSLRDAVLDFIQDGRIDGQPINLDYKAGMAQEKAYSEKFGARLADYLNAQGFRDGKARFTAVNVMNKVRNRLTENERLAQSLETTVGEALASFHGPKSDPNLMFPPRYIAAAARNACRYGVGNCEECGCTAFAMFVTLRKPDGAPIVQLADNERPVVELVHARSEGDAHFFVLVNRPGANDILADFSNWFANPKTIVCDPWITDQGVGGPITATSEGMRELQEYLKPGGTGGPQFLAVRARGFVGATPEGFKDDPSFGIPWD